MNSSNADAVRKQMDYYFRPDSLFQVSPANCSGNPHRSSCQLLESEVDLCKISYGKTSVGWHWAYLLCVYTRLQTKNDYVKGGLGTVLGSSIPPRVCHATPIF